MIFLIFICHFFILLKTKIIFFTLPAYEHVNVLYMVARRLVNTSTDVVT